MKISQLIKSYLLLAVAVLLISACQEPYFDKPFKEGKNTKEFPAAWLGEYKIIMSEYDSADYSRDTLTDRGIKITPKSMYFFSFDDPELLSDDDEFVKLNDSSTWMVKYKGVYYLSEMVAAKPYYKIRQIKPVKNGLLVKYIDYSDDAVKAKLKAHLDFKEEFFVKSECYGGCNIGLFGFETTAVHRFFETQLPDSTAILLIKK